MDSNLFLTVFGTVFLAELGDKTQLATLLFAADQQVNKWLVFFSASLALICTSALGVAAGGLISRHVAEKQLAILAGCGFIIIGIWTLRKAF
ncbi:MAG: TMEM165/GDT1 family protein [Deltaproteobacteria bacterium]|nr:TMEM165/GDT1 family protein [Candidatus Anaeroferrophillus wilburensis]MBN2887941.1 TMEM165/GDT1 family protein [Deltaproteobacteria bacterium]